MENCELHLQNISSYSNTMKGHLADISGTVYNTRNDIFQMRASTEQNKTVLDEILVELKKLNTNIGGTQ